MFNKDVDTGNSLKLKRKDKAIWSAYSCCGQFDLKRVISHSVWFSVLLDSNSLWYKGIRKDELKRLWELLIFIQTQLIHAIMPFGAGISGPFFSYLCQIMQLIDSSLGELNNSTPCLWNEKYPINKSFCHMLESQVCLTGRTVCILPSKLTKQTPEQRIRLLCLALKKRC